MNKRNILFIPHNAYHTYNMHLIMQELRILGADCQMLNIDSIHHEGVTEEAKKLNIKTIPYSALFLFKYKPTAIVTMNDWGAVTKKNILLANLLGIPTFGIVEGVQDFQDTHLKTHSEFKPRFPYVRSKFPLLAGEYDKKFIKNKDAHIIGIARIEELINKKTSYPKTPKVIINANFSYGKYSRHAKEWIQDAVNACTELGVDYTISQHIADKTDLSKVNVSTEHINDLVCKGSLLISRFSTSILEAMAIGKPIIYFNSFNEKVDKFLNPEGSFESPKNKEELKESIKRTLENPSEYVEKSKNFLNLHVSFDPKKSSARRAAEFIFTNRQYRDIRTSEKIKIISDEIKRRYLYSILNISL